ncbi:hypothetical protein Nepgr_021144 [Nepenthes gracilis]|uniref:Uncharacterized protein n=1 Tax=Nepenthes gracilis TaxID=150966 RepID=A0AAD3XVV7_NEPGR|nr:hypothetical protein Nepgr_021144 [Nepenthes gracilis]
MEEVVTKAEEPGEPLLWKKRIMPFPTFGPLDSARIEAMERDLIEGVMAGKGSHCPWEGISNLANAIPLPFKEVVPCCFSPLKVEVVDLFDPVEVQHEPRTFLTRLMNEDLVKSFAF